MAHLACPECASTRVMPVRIKHNIIHYSCISCGHQFSVIDPGDTPSTTQTSRPLPPVPPPSTRPAARKSES